MRKKQLGFTLVEILAVIVILGILSGVAIGGYSTYIKKAKKNYYIAQEKLLTQSGRDFYNDNKGKMPQASGEESCVTLNTLINFKYIDKVLDYNKKVCNGDKSKACVKKLSNTNNLYYSYLNCGNEFTSVEYKNPELQFSLTDGNTASRDNEEYKLIMTVNDTATKNVSQENYGVASYRYVIYKKYSGENNNDLVYYDTGWKSIKGKNQEKVVVNINLDSDGTYYVRGWAYNWGGKEANGKSGEVTLKFKLDCKNQIEFSADNYVQNTWTNSNIDTLITKKGGVNKFDVSLENTDVDTNSVTNSTLVVGHNTRDKNINITSNGKNKLKVICYDSNNNTDTTESIYYQIDKVRPTCSVSRDAGIGYDSLHYTNKDLNLTAVCSDKGGSGCKQANTSVTLTASQDRSLPSYQVANIYDKAGNSTTCTTGVYQDVTPPKISVTMTKRSSTSETASVNNDEYKNNSWSNKYITIFLSNSDSVSGIKSGYPQLWIDSGSATNSSNGNQGKWLSRTQFDVNAEGVSTLKFRTMDNAGNTKTTSSYTIKLDHSKPSFTSLTTSNNKISFAAKDTISGIKSYCVKIKGGDCTNDSGYVAVNSGSTYSLSNISKITTSKKTTIQAGTTYTVVVKDYAGNSISKDISTSLTFVKTKYWSTRFCTMHNGVANASGGSTTKSCSQAVDSGTNCYTAGYNVNNHGDKTYANMKISSLTTSVSGSDLKVKITFAVANGYFGTYSSGYNRYMCLKKGNRTFTNANCTSDTQSVKTDWSGNGKSVDITKTFTIKNYNSKAGSYSFKMWGDTYKTSCSSNVNALDQIYSFQTDYIFELK